MTEFNDVWRWWTQRQLMRDYEVEARRADSLQVGIQRLIDDLDRARADGSIYTYGQVQQRLWDLLEGEQR